MYLPSLTRGNIADGRVGSRQLTLSVLLCQPRLFQFCPNRPSHLLVWWIIWHTLYSPARSHLRKGKSINNKMSFVCIVKYISDFCQYLSMKLTKYILVYFLCKYIYRNRASPQPLQRYHKVIV